MKDIGRFFRGPKPPEEAQTNYLTLEEAAQKIPVFNCSLLEMDTELEAKKWNEWAGKFMEKYCDTPESDREPAYVIISQHKPHDLVELLAATWKLRNNFPPSVVLGIYDGVAKYFVKQTEVGLSEEQRKFIQYLSTCSRIPDIMKYGFPSWEGRVLPEYRLRQVHTYRLERYFESKEN